ncbi:MAG: RNA polymerase sigma factor [Verrucomicrobiota bacterium]
MTHDPESEHEQDLSDIELMLRVRDGDTEAFVPLIQRYQEKLLNFFTRLGVYHEAEDLVQETFVRIYRSRKDYREKAKFSTYLYVVARNIWRDFLRRTGRYQDFKTKFQDELEHREPPRTDDPSTRLDIETALDKLSDKLRMVMVMKVQQGLKYQEIADALDVPLGTVKSRMKLAVDQLKELMK